MVNVKQFALSLLPALQSPHDDGRAPARKSIAIVGGGTAGIAVLKRIVELAQAERAGWDFVLYEQRRDVGGVWCVARDGPRLLHVNDAQAARLE